MGFEEAITPVEPEQQRMDLERDFVGTEWEFERFDGFENRGLQRKPVVDKESRANPDEPI